MRVSRVEGRDKKKKVWNEGKKRTVERVTIHHENNLPLYSSLLPVKLVCNIHSNGQISFTWHGIFDRDCTPFPFCNPHLCNNFPSSHPIPPTTSVR